jgi:uncharacterized protein YuzE
VSVFIWKEQEPLIEFQLDRDVNALYVKLRSVDISRTIELTDSINVDMDANDAPVGIEFTNADDFIPFLRNHADRNEIPPQVRELFRVV